MSFFLVVIASLKCLISFFFVRHVFIWLLSLLLAIGNQSPSVSSSLFAFLLSFFLLTFHSFFVFVSLAFSLPFAARFDVPLCHCSPYSFFWPILSKLVPSIFFIVYISLTPSSNAPRLLFLFNLRTRCMPPPHQLAQQPATASPNNRLVDTGIYGTPAFAMQRPAPHRAEAPASRPAPGRRAQRSALAPVHTQHSAIETFAADAALLRAMGGSMPREAIPPGRRRPGDPLPQLASENGTRTREVPPAAPESEASYRGAAAGQARSSDGRTTPLSSLGGLNASSPSSLQGSRSGTPASGTTSTSPADAPNRAHAGAHHMNMPHRGTTSPPPLVLLPGPRYTPSLARRQHEHGLYVLSPPTNSRPQDMSFAAHPAPSPDRSLHAYSMALGVVTPEQHRYSRADAGGDLNHYSFASGASATPESRTYAAASGSAFATPPQGQQLLTRPGGDSGSGFVRRAGPRYSAYFRQRSDGSSRRKRSGSNGRSVAASLGSASGEELEGRVSERSAAAPHIYDRSAPRIYDRGNAQVRERSDPVYSHGNQPGTPSVSAADYTSAPTPEMLAYDHRTLPEGDLSDTPAGYATVAGVRPRHVPEYSRADAPPTPLAPVLPAAAAAASSPQYDVGTAETGQTHSAPQPPQSPHYALADEVDADTAADTAHSPPQYVLADPRQPKMSRVSEEGDEIHGAARGIDEGQAKPRNSEEEQAEPNVAAASSEEEQIEPHTSRSHEESEVQQVQDDATDAPGTPPLQDEV